VFKVIVDTREQNDLSFGQFQLEVIREGLSFGDYAAVGTGEICKDAFLPIFFERKSLSDLSGTIQNKENHKRFHQELLRAQDVNAKLLLAIEGTDQQVMDECGMSVMKALTTMWMRYDLMPLFCSSRWMMEWRMVNIWAAYIRSEKK